MNVHAAVMTGKGVGAIATVCLIGKGAADIIKSIFKPIGKDNVQFEAGKILLGNIVNDKKIIDQVVIGCERENEFAINCHGNPLIVEMIMELLAKHGAEPVNAERLTELQFLQSKIQNLKSKIAVEARLAQLKAKTIEGYKLLQNQIEGGLAAKAIEWKTKPLETIQKEVANILKASQAAAYIIHGCKVVIAGPANSGKSALLNCLAGREKSIVADIPGTTRDWVSAHCTVGPLAMEIIDTAGFDESLILKDAIDKEAQKRSIELIEQADVIIWVVDGSDEISNFKSPIANVPMVIALNKSDLGLKFDKAQLKKELGEPVVMSAKNGTGIDELIRRIRTVLGVEGFDLKQAVCFTIRQKELAEQMLTKSDETALKPLINELLNGHIGV
jgi:tRNA modification GTPase